MQRKDGFCSWWSARPKDGLPNGVKSAIRIRVDAFLKRREYRVVLDGSKPRGSYGLANFFIPPQPFLSKHTPSASTISPPLLRTPPILYITPDCILNAMPISKECLFRDENGTPALQRLLKFAFNVFLNFS